MSNKNGEKKYYKQENIKIKMQIIKLNPYP